MSSSIKAAYRRFLEHPTTNDLRSDACLHYIPTLTTQQGADAIVKHLSGQHQILLKKKEQVLSAIESQDGLCLDVDTTIEFLSGGGAYLPGLDDNFLADRVVTFPIVRLGSSLRRGPDS